MTLLDNATPTERGLIEAGAEKGYDPLYSLYALRGMNAAEAAVWRHMGIAMAEGIGASDVDRSFFEDVPLRVAREARSLVVREDEDRKIVVCMVDPLDRKAHDQLRSRIPNRTFRVLLMNPDVMSAIFMTIANEIAEEGRREILETERSSAPVDEVEALDAAASEESLRWRRMIEGWIAQAAENNASDIHLDHWGARMTVRMRIDGRLVEISTVTADDASRIQNVIKGMSGMQMTIKRQPQDGRMVLTLPTGNRVALRVASAPLTEDRERIVMRVQNPAQSYRSVPSIGFSTSVTEGIMVVLRKRSGIFVVTGPPGEGKTSTLYTALSSIAGPSVSTVSVEDPIESPLNWVSQSEVVRGHFDFPVALRTLLRNDPDFIFIGEIRDRETAEIAVEAAMVGRLVLTTMHVNRAVEAVERFVTLGVEPRMLAPTLQAVMNQRLVLTLCEHCRRDGQLPPGVEPRWHPEVDEGDLHIREADPNGCEACFHTGYRGRKAIAEFVPFSLPELRQAVSERMSSEEIAARATELGTIDLRTDGMRLVANGETSYVALEEKIGTN